MNNFRHRDTMSIAAQIAASPAVEHAPLAEMSHMAAMAAHRLQGNRAVSAEEMRLVLSLLRGIENIGLVGFLRRHGTEADYQAIGVSVARRFAPPPARRP